jgi:hypothetical protein
VFHDDSLTRKLLVEFLTIGFRERTTGVSFLVCGDDRGRSGEGGVGKDEFSVVEEAVGLVHDLVYLELRRKYS